MLARNVFTIALLWGALVALGVSRGAEATPVPVQGGVVKLTPQNTKIQFVCAHVGARPDPRKGGFAKFAGEIRVDPATKALKSVDIDIDTTSLSTEVGDKLTNHLKSPDFFEVRRYPSAHFESTKIVPAAGAQQLTGKLTLHGVTKEISFPATVEVGPSGLTLRSEFTIDRLEFGINYDPKKVENKVSLTVVVGEKS
jgi:polyisoprenoid-binding protein YceI